MQRMLTLLRNTLTDLVMAIEVEDETLVQLLANFRAPSS